MISVIVWRMLKGRTKACGFDSGEREARWPSRGRRRSMAAIRRNSPRRVRLYWLAREWNRYESDNRGALRHLVSLRAVSLLSSTLQLRMDTVKILRRVYNRIASELLHALPPSALANLSDEFLRLRHRSQEAMRQREARRFPELAPPIS